MEKAEFKKLLNSAKKYYEKATLATCKAYSEIERSFPDITLSDISTDAENADSL